MSKTKFFVVYLVTLISLTLFCSSCSNTEESLESVVARVNNPKTENNTWIVDETGLLNNSQNINQLITEYEAESSVEIAVVILPTIGDFVPKDFAVALFNHWGIGKKGKDNGILILHILDQRRIEIETGYGMEGVLPDVTVKRIIDTYTIPAFKADDFSKGHIETVTAIINKLRHPETDIQNLVAKSDASNSDLSSPEEEYKPYKRDDLYDYKGKSYSELSPEELQIFHQTLEKFNSISDYLLDDEESRLLSEKNEFEDKIKKEESIQFRINFSSIYLLILFILFATKQILYWLFSSPDIKYKLTKNTDFPIFYGTLIFPFLVVIQILSYFWETEAIFLIFFFGIFFLVIYNIFWGDLRLKRLSERLLKIRNIPRKCPECSEIMTKLSEKDDNLYLSKGQIAEEILKSIDYDVWICSSCNANQILPFQNLNPEYIFDGTSFPKIKKCPECKFETYYCKDSRVLSSATYSSSGKVEVVRLCKNCKHTDVEYETIPKKQKSSSGGGGSGGGGGGSFGGGSSGGGGSGGSY